MRTNLSKQIRCIVALFSLILISVAAKAKAKPTIESISPISAKPSDVVTIVSVNFSGTVAQTDVYLGNARVTTFSSASTGGVRVIVPVGATYGPILVYDKSNKNMLQVAN